MLGGPEPPHRFVGQGDGGLGVAESFGEREGPALGGVEAGSFRVADRGRPQGGAGTVDQQHAQVAFAATCHFPELAFGSRQGVPMNRAIFHLSLPVHDLDETRAFYCAVLGAVPGRATAEWIDLILFGHQLTFHQCPEQVAAADAQGVRHFGALLAWEDWEALCASVLATGAPLMVPPTVSGEGTAAEQGKLLLRDPDGYVLEFKAYRDISTVLPAGAMPR